MGEIKQTNFRVDQERADAFRAYCEANGINQATGFERMLEALELQQAKEAIPSRETEISEFERCLRHLQGAYLTSLELNEQAEARVREEYARDLDRSKKLLDEKIEQIDALKEEVKGLAGAAEQVQQLQAALTAAEEQARKDRMEVEDRDRTIKHLTGTIEIFQIKGEAYDDLKADRDALAEQLRDAEASIKDMKKDHEMAMERAASVADKAQAAAVAAAIAAGEEKASELRAQLQKAQIEGAKALQDAERAAHEADKEAAAEIRRLETGKSDLRIRVTQLEAELAQFRASRTE